MDVRLSVKQLVFFVTFFLIAGCGDRLNVDTEHGRQAAIDEANYQLSVGNCDAALQAINPLYSSKYLTEEIVILTAAGHACKSKFSLISLVSHLSKVSSTYGNNTFSALAHSEFRAPVFGLYEAVDILTNNDNVKNALQRSVDRNNYMIFLQLAIIGAIEATYGNPDPTTGAQSTLLTGNISALDACGLEVALAHLYDSFAHSSLAADANATSAVNTFNAICGGAGCSAWSKDRTSCTNQVAVVTAIDAGW
jgi:hypothetical protein